MMVETSHHENHYRVICNVTAHDRELEGRWTTENYLGEVSKTKKLARVALAHTSDMLREGLLCDKLTHAKDSLPTMARIRISPGSKLLIHSAFPYQN